MITAVFDLDGCLACSPSAVTIGLDSPTWDRVWSDPVFPANPEIVQLYHALKMAGWHCLILTGRPNIYLHQTLLWFKQLGILAPPLYMIPPDRTDVAAWKVEMIQRFLDHGFDVRFVVEDYKPNAEALRRIVPVLLYERKKLHS